MRYQKDGRRFLSLRVKKTAEGATFTKVMLFNGSPVRETYKMNFVGKLSASAEDVARLVDFVAGVTPEI